MSNLAETYKEQRKIHVTEITSGMKLMISEVLDIDTNSNIYDIVHVVLVRKCSRIQDNTMCTGCRTNGWIMDIICKKGSSDFCKYKFVTLDGREITYE
jgi:hypothetical protein